MQDDKWKRAIVFHMKGFSRPSKTRHSHRFGRYSPPYPRPVR
jgi:hypothetical protein